MDLTKALEKAGKHIRVASDAAQVSGWLHSGNYALNYAISGRFNRGWPLGHMGEIFGDNSTGKSFLVDRAIAEIQKAGGRAILDDSEGGFSEAWARQQLGIDTESLLYDRSGTVKEHFDFVQMIIDAYDKSDEPVPLLVALDSLAVLTTEHEREVGLTKPSMTKAKEVRAFLRILGKELHDRKIFYLLTNHQIANIGAAFWESDTTTPGGGGPKFECSVRVSMRTPKKIKSNKDVVGVIVRAVVEKTRFRPPWGEAEIAIPYNRPINSASGLIPILLDLGVIQMDGHTLSYEGEDTGIKAHKTKKLKQDMSGLDLLQKFPDILEKADAMLDKRDVETFRSEDFANSDIENEEETAND